MGISILAITISATLSCFYGYFHLSNKNSDRLITDKKKSLIKLRILLNELDRSNPLGIPIKTKKIAKYWSLESQNKIKTYYYEEFIEIFEKFKKSDDYYNYYSIPKKFIDSTIDRNYEFEYKNTDRENYSENLDCLKNLVDDELNKKY